MKRLFIPLTLALFTVFSSCSSDDTEVDKEEPTDSTTTISFSSNAREQYFESLKKEPLQKTIDSWSDMPFVTPSGTKIENVGNWSFVDSDGESIDYPFEIEVLDLYSAGEMIRNNAPTTSNGQLLVSGGEMRVRFYKDGEQLSLRDGYTYNITVPASTPDSEMELFVGGNEDELIDWEPVNAADSTFIFEQAAYYLNMDTIGWINCDYFYSSTAPLTTITFNGIYNGDTIDISPMIIYLYFEDINSLLSSNGTETGNIPTGMENVHVIAFGATDENLFYDHQVITTEQDQIITIEPEIVTEEDFESFLDDL